MKDEFTSKMHEEFSVDTETEIKHRCWSALAMIKDTTNKEEVASWANIYMVTVEDVLKFSKIL